jgi:hypothetical protein
MQPAQAKSPRKRRRWLIVGIILLLLSLCSWWYFPRGDARFVGRWQVSFYTSNSRFARSVILVLKSNGAGETYAEGRRGGDFAWAVQSNVFREGSPTIDRMINDAIERFQHRLPNSVPRVVTYTAEEDIVSVQADGIEMSKRSGGRVVFKRLPE